MTVRLDNRVAIVTGAGAGLGRAHALMLAGLGAGVVVNDTGGTVDGRGGDQAVADRVVAEIKAAGGRAVASYDSVASFVGAQHIVDTATKNFGRLDILINNAGILRDQTFLDMEIEDFEAVFGVHFMGALYCTKAAWPLLMAQKYGRVVLTTSGSGLVGNLGQSAYGAAKTALLGLCNVLAKEGAESDVKINLISPVARTRMVTSPAPTAAAATATSAMLTDPRLLAFMAPEYVAAAVAVAWLASEQCNVSGEILGAAGGYYTAVRFYRSAGVMTDLEAPIGADAFEAVADQVFDFAAAERFEGVGGELVRRLMAAGKFK